MLHQRKLELTIMETINSNLHHYMCQSTNRYAKAFQLLYPPYPTVDQMFLGHAMYNEKILNWKTPSSCVVMFSV